jgi:hypothetical protein
LSVEDLRQTIEFSSQALQKTNLTSRGRIRALYVLSEAYCRLRQPESALPWLEQLVTLRRQGGDWFRLAVCRDLVGDGAGGLKAALHSVEIMPTDPKFHDLVAELADKYGESQLADKHRRLAQQLRGNESEKSEDKTIRR